MDGLNNNICNIYNIRKVQCRHSAMAKSDSGRVVVDLTPSIKRRLYSALALENKSLKEWMMERIEWYLAKDHGDLNTAARERK